MKFGLRQLFLWHLIFYFIINGARDIFLFGETDRHVFDSIFAFTSIFVFFIYVFLTYSVLYKFYPKGKWIYCIIGIALTFLIGVSTRYLVEQIITLKLFDSANYNLNFDIRYYIRDNYGFGVRYMTFATIYYFIRYSIYEKGREKDLIVEKQKIDLKTLNAQINPHFLLNSINNIYSLVYQKSDTALHALDKLSDILKYNLYEKAEFVPIKKELEIIDQFVELQKLKYDFPINIEVYSFEDEGIQIPRLLILPIIENAFKHGVVNDQENPISLVIESADDQIIIKSSNKKTKAVFKDGTGGIGLENIKSRLALLYQDKAKIQINEDNDYFSMQIIIPRVA